MWVFLRSWLSPPALLLGTVVGGVLGVLGVHGVLEGDACFHAQFRYRVQAVQSPHLFFADGQKKTAEEDVPRAPAGPEDLGQAAQKGEKALLQTKVSSNHERTLLAASCTVAVQLDSHSKIAQACSFAGAHEALLWPQPSRGAWHMPQRRAPTLSLDV